IRVRLSFVSSLRDLDSSQFTQIAPWMKKSPLPVPGSEEDPEEKAAHERLVRRLKVTRLPSSFSSVQVAFGPSNASSSALRTFGKLREENDRSGGSVVKDASSDDGQLGVSSLSISRTDEATGSSLTKRNKKEYIEPWVINLLSLSLLPSLSLPPSDTFLFFCFLKLLQDYHHTYYPVSLPLRRPYSGDPEILNEAEFGTADAEEYKENPINSASELGLREENEEKKMLFLQLPNNLPLVKREAGAAAKLTDEGSNRSILSGHKGVPAGGKGKEVAGSSLSFKGQGAPAMAKGKELAVSSLSGKEVVDRPTYSWKGNSPKKGCNLEELPMGYMGKMLVYKSGAVKLKLGDTLFDVSPGSDCVFAQDVVAINTTNKHCCVLGELGKRAVVAPDINSLLEEMI
ncbi:hypothetical protein RJ640_022825, partial [Escallonia rubra]